MQEFSMLEEYEMYENIANIIYSFIAVYKMCNCNMNFMFVFTYGHNKLSYTT